MSEGGGCGNEPKDGGGCRDPKEGGGGGGGRDPKEGGGGGGGRDPKEGGGGGGGRDPKEGGGGKPLKLGGGGGNPPIPPPIPPPRPFCSSSFLAFLKPSESPCISSFLIGTCSASVPPPCCFAKNASRFFFLSIKSLDFFGGSLGAS